MMLNQDTVDRLKADIELWEHLCHEAGTWHGSDAFQAAIKAMDRWSGTVDVLEHPVPTTHRILPRPFLVEWAELITKAN